MLQFKFSRNSSGNTANAASTGSRSGDSLARTLGFFLHRPASVVGLIGRTVSSLLFMIFVSIQILRRTSDSVLDTERVEKNLLAVMISTGKRRSVHPVAGVGWCGRRTDRCFPLPTPAAVSAFLRELPKFQSLLCSPASAGLKFLVDHTLKGALCLPVAQTLPLSKTAAQL
jgi:hypothetical protein